MNDDIANPISHPDIGVNEINVKENKESSLPGSDEEKDYNEIICIDNNSGTGEWK
jgi:hypothetical protein